MLQRMAVTSPGAYALNCNDWITCWTVLVSMKPDMNTVISRAWKVDEILFIPPEYVPFLELMDEEEDGDKPDCVHEMNNRHILQGFH